ncbi:MULTISPECIES: AraC family transcriptional regulator [Marinobacter]|uniref:AraC family transcriptional regulator n=1 Tax=Marinobacter suaedae TaxID=3057675 RepID=A0ABT8VYB1_9GAMM|nr:MULTISPECIES: AraC family transcriptional regulator [unclassified Marinobacter]MBZ2169098.1 AraC family transcriptional regulator [Marinobacter sp. F4216]MDO3720967.1 AraC family transcriptional regulator [Marinobacter sp. chi1]
MSEEVMTDAPLIRVRAMTAVPDVIRELGADPEPFLAGFHLREEMIDDPKQMMPYLNLIQMMEQAAEEFGCPDFGLRVGLKQGMTVLGPIAVIAQNSSTVEEALNHVIQYIGYHSPAVLLRLQPQEETKARSLQFDIALTEGQQRAQTVEMSLVLAIQVLRVLIGRDFVPRHVRFRHKLISPTARYRTIFAGPVSFGEPVNAIAIANIDLTRPIRQSDPALLNAMEEFVRQKLAQQRSTLRENVRSLVISLLPLERRCTITLIARHLAVSERTLQRRLKKEDIVFEELVDDVRRELAEDYLRERSMSMNQVAGLLGYGQQSSFNRACSRWFGQSPKVIRAQLLASH